MEKRNIIAYEDRKIVRVSRNIVEQLRLNVSLRTVRRKLKETDLKNCVARRNSYILKIQKKKRLNFAKKYINKPLSFWKQIIWRVNLNY